MNQPRDEGLLGKAIKGFALFRITLAALYLLAFAVALFGGWAQGDGSGLEFLVAGLLAFPWSMTLLLIGPERLDALPFAVRFVPIVLGALLNAWIIGLMGSGTRAFRLGKGGASASEESSDG